MKILPILFISLCAFATTVTHAQDMHKIAEALTAAREAYDGGNYRTAVEKIKIVENEIGSTTRPATAYIKIMSYYKLKEYQNCVDAANAYLNGGEAKQDETLTEIRNAMQESKRVLSEREAERQRQLAAQEAERKRQEELAHAKAAHEKEAAERWQQISTSEDLTVLSAFMDKYGNTPSKAAAQARYNDEKAWQDAKKANYIENYEAYLNGKTELRHRQEARDILEKAYPRLCKEAAANGNIGNMESLYNRYTTMFPQGSEKAELQAIMCKIYYDKGMALSKNRKNSNDLYQANQLLRKQQNLCGTIQGTAETIRKNNRRITDLARPLGHFFIGYTGTPVEPIGATMGGLFKHGIGFYLGFRANSNAFKGEGDVTIVKAVGGYFANVDSEEYAYRLIEESGMKYDQFKGNLSIVAGLNKRIIHPVWIYLGGGINRVNHFGQLSPPKNYNENVSGSWEGRMGGKYIITGTKTQWSPLIDAGLQLKFGYFYISGGIQSVFKTDGSTSITFGAGFAF